MTPALAARVSLGALFSVALVASAHAAERLPGETVVASRGGATITLADVDASLLRIPARQRADAMNSPKRIEDLVNQLLLTRQLNNIGVEQGLQRDAQVQRAIEMAGENVIGGQAVLKFREDLQLGDLEAFARERYNANPTRYDIPANVTVRHILIGSDRRSDADALAIANQVHARAVKGDDFEALVEEYSEDPSKGGNRGQIQDADSAKMDPMFAEASSRLTKVGELAPVTKSQFGYHIIRFENRTQAKPRTYDEVRPAIIAELRATLTEQRVKEYIDQLRSMSLDANPDAVASLRTRYLPSQVLPDITGAQAPADGPIKSPNRKRDEKGND